MWVRMTMWDQTIELGVFDHWVITARPPWKIKHWLDRGLVQVPEERVGQAIRAALREVREEDVPSLWRQLFEFYGGPPPGSVDAMASELIWDARGSVPRLIVLDRLIERGFRFEPLVWNFRRRRRRGGRGGHRNAGHGQRIPAVRQVLLLGG